MTGAALYVHAAHLRPPKCHMAAAAERAEARDGSLSGLHARTCPWSKPELTAELFMSTAQQCSPVRTFFIFIDTTGDPSDSELLHNMYILHCAQQMQGSSDQRSPADKFNQ